MVRTVLRIISVIMVSAFVCINAHAAWRIVFDRNCLKIVMANTASQKVIEEQQTSVWIPLQPRNRRWNSIR